ncbi:MAG: phage tail protein [Liquorilactobacillus sp.]|jgi:GH25 family lysozyme M1 (1,4-beta-N-acetylmuramidase)
MYRIIAFDSPTDSVGKVIFDLSMNKLLSAGKLTLVESGIDNAELTVNIKNSLFGKVEPFQTHISVLQDNKLIFRGRALKPTRAMTSGGLFQQTFTFESILSYLLDSVQRFKEVHNTTPAQFFSDLIDVHNSQVPAYKQFKVGKVDVTNSTDNVYRYVEYENTYDTIKDKLIDRLGGYLVLRIESDGNYLDYVQNPGSDHQNDTPILLGKNLKSSSVEIDPTSIITRLVPLGATIESTDENNTSAAYPRVTISSVNGGKDYIDIPDLQTEFGIINGTQTWEDVNDANILLTKAKAWIANQKAATESWNVEAVELLNSNFENFKVSDRYRFVNDLVAEQQYLRVIQKDIDFTKPQNSTLTIGGKTARLTDYQLENQKAAKEVNQLTDKLNAQQNKIVILNENLTNANKVIKNLTDIPDEIKKIQQQIQELQNNQDDPDIHVGKIIDVSEFQTDIDFNALKNDDVSLVIIRVQYGSNRADNYYQQNIARAQTAGVRFAVYAYARYVSDVDAQQEALDFYNRTKAAVGSGTGPVFYMIDIEEVTVTSGTARSAAAAWVSKMNTLGVSNTKLVAYIANHLYDTFNIDVSQFGSIMIPSYGKNDGTVAGSTPPTHPYDLWQYTSVGSVSGISGNVDMSTAPSDRFKTQYLK